MDLRAALARGGRAAATRPLRRRVQDGPPFPGDLVEGEAGAWRRIVRRFSCRSTGAGPAAGLDDVLERGPGVAADHAAALVNEERLREVPLERWLFVDTETSGLSLGGGTLAWIVGLAWLERHDGGWQVVVEQHVLDGMRAERALLGAVLDRVRAAGALVTYNGRSFDVPLLDTRCVLNRLAGPERLPHADLLHPARRLLATVLPDLRLVTLERHVLGFEREDDMPGAEVPQAWFDWLHAGRTDGVVRAVRHNEWDLLALVGAFAALVRLAAGERVRGVAADGVALVEHRLRLGDAEGARHELERLDAFGGTMSEGPRGRRRARLARRLLGPEAARDCWRRLVEGGDRTAEAHEELAKMLEHRDRDVAGARRIVARALAHRQPDGARARLERRLARLDARLAAARDAELAPSRSVAT